MQQRIDQKALRIVQQRLGLALEMHGHHLQRQLRRDLAFGMAAHAVGQHEEHGLPRVAVAHAVFIERPAAAAAQLKYRKPHGLRSWPTAGRPAAPLIFCMFFLASVTSVSSCRRMRSETLSLV